MKQQIHFLLASIAIISIGKVQGQTTNTPPLPTGETVIGGHLHAGASNEIWTDASNLYFNYQGAGGVTHFWNLGGASGSPVMTILKNGKVGIGESAPLGNLHIGKQEAPANTAGEAVRLVLQPYGHTGGPWKFVCRDVPGSAYLDLYYGTGQAITIHHSGNVLIGKTTQTNTAYKLDVAGKIRADEIVVNTSGADFVFEPTYKLRTLPELETFIKEHKHLPEIAPAKEMQENGVSSGEMQTKLLQKVEELTLYTIELEKRVKELESKSK